MKDDEKGIFLRNMKRLCYKFGITNLTYLRILEIENYSCAICKKHYCEIPGRMCLDHKHDCCDDYGDDIIEPRGFLCTNCNFLIGYANDNIKIIKKAIDYLENNAFYDNILYSPNKKHKLSKDNRQEIYLEQGGRCKICGIKESRLNRELYTDHDHNTGKIRGLLCGKCNSILGLCYDDINILKNSILYLKRNLGEEMYYNIDVAIIRGEPLPTEFIKYENILGKDWTKMYKEYTKNR
jgi:hypothetical protein